MARGVFMLTALAFGNAAAFVVPLAPRTVVAGIGRNPFCASARARPSTRAHHAEDIAPLNMRYVAMNNFKVKLGCEDEFETMWRERESNLASFSGFEQFMLLKVDTKKEQEEREGEGGEFSAGREGYTEFISHTVWAHQMDFEEWKRSQAFKKSHGGGGSEGGSEGGKAGGGGMSKMGELIVGRPTPAMFHAVVIEPVPPEHAGGLWDFENEPSYFDGDM